MGYKDKWHKQGYEAGKQQGYEAGKAEAAKEFNKIAINTVTGAVIGGIFMIAKEIISSGFLTADFVSGFMIGLLVGAGVGFGFGMLFMIKRMK
jgi:ethanolamine ammonia-lyase large subunit